MKESKNVYQASTYQKKAVVAILISSKFLEKNITKDKHGYFLVIKESNLQEDTKVLNVDSNKNRVLKEAKIERTYRKNRKFHNYSLRFHHLFSIGYFKSQQNSSKEYRRFEKTINIYRTFHPIR